MFLLGSLYANPDLIVWNIETSSNPTIGGKCTVIVQLKNIGDKATPATGFIVRLQKTVHNGEKQLVYNASIPPNGGLSDKAKLNFTNYNVGTETAYVYVHVDADLKNNVIENNEKNNYKLGKIPVASPDLIIKSIEISPNPPSPNSPVIFDVWVQNQGVTSAFCNNSTVRIYKNGWTIWGSDGSKPCAFSLKSGESKKVSFSFTKCGGTSGTNRTVYADVDSNNIVKSELWETNNTGTRGYTPK